MVRYWAHHRTNGHAVEAVVHEYQYAHEHRGQLRADPGVYARFSPAPESRGRTGLVHQHHQAAQYRYEHQYTCVRKVREVYDKTAGLAVEQSVVGQLQVAAGEQQRADKYAHEQGAVDFLGYESQDYGHHRRRQSPYGGVQRRLVAFGCLHVALRAQYEAHHNDEDDDEHHRKAVISADRGSLFFFHDMFPLRSTCGGSFRVCQRTWRPWL